MWLKLERKILTNLVLSCMGFRADERMLRRDCVSPCLPTWTTTINKQEFKSRHSEVFSLGRHPKEFFVQRFGENHFRLIGNTYFAFVDGCWVAVDVDGFVYAERVICPGDPDFIEVVD